jgi:uncharacterized protein YndB with AHSA1/START domain/predicted enzyme related to lactoylglutathione lyase
MTTVAQPVTLRVTRLIKAPRERVFAAWTTPDEIMKWFGPKTCRVLSAKVDLRVGGEYYFRVDGKMGQLDLRGVYREVKPPSRLVYTWNWKGHPEVEFGETLVTVDFVDRDGATEVQITHEGLPNAEQRDNHNHGWNGCLDKLAANVGAQAPDKTPGIFCWNELVSRDVDASTKFYTQLFGWTAESMNMGPGMTYTFLKAGNQNAAGLLQMPKEAGQAPTTWMGYITVSDLAAAVAQAKSLGAKICKDITNLPMGRLAIITDPQGATLGLWEFGDSSAGNCS